MKVADLKKGTVYAWAHSHGADIRRIEEFTKVEYLGPAKAEYDRYRPTKKLNSGMVRVKFLARWHGRLTWGGYTIEDVPEGAERDVKGQEIMMAWADLEERAGETLKAGVAMQRYLEDLRHVVHEIEPDCLVDHEHGWNYYHSDKDKRPRVEVNLHISDEGTRFDPEDGMVKMPVEFFRKLLMGVKV